MVSHHRRSALISHSDRATGSTAAVEGWERVALSVSRPIPALGMPQSLSVCVCASIERAIVMFVYLTSRNQWSIFPYLQFPHFPISISQQALVKSFNALFYLQHALSSANRQLSGEN